MPQSSLVLHDFVFGRERVYLLAKKPGKKMRETQFIVVVQKS